MPENPKKLSNEDKLKIALSDWSNVKSTGTAGKYGYQGAISAAFGNTDFGESRYDVDSTPSQYIESGNYNYFRGERQPALAKLGAGLANAVTQTGIDIIKDASYLFDYENYTDFKKSSEEGFNNWMAEALTKVEDKLKLPVYERREAEGFSPLYPEWWGKNIPSIVSTVSMMIPAEAAVMGLGKIGKLLGGNKIIQGIENVSGARGVSDALKGVTGAVISRQMENIMEGGQTFEDTYDKAIKAGKSEQEAKQIAGEAAAQNYKLNWANLATDIPQYMLLHKTFKKSMDDMQFSVKELAKTMIQEGGEEGYQFITNEESKRAALLKADVLTDDHTDLSDRMKEYAKDGEFWSSVFLGGLGGGIFSGIASYQNSKNFDKAQQQYDLLTKLHAAVVKGDKETFNRVSDEAFGNELINSFKLDQIDQFKDMLNQTIELPEDPHERMETQQRLNKRNEIIDFAKKLQTEISKDNTKSPELRALELSTAINQKLTSERLEQINTEITKLQSKDMSSLQLADPTLYQFKIAKLNYEAIKDIPSMQKEAAAMLVALENNYKMLESEGLSRKEIDMQLTSPHDKELMSLFKNRQLDNRSLRENKKILYDLSTTEGKEAYEAELALIKTQMEEERKAAELAEQKKNAPEEETLKDLNEQKQAVEQTIKTPTEQQKPTEPVDTKTKKADIETKERESQKNDLRAKIEAYDKTIEPEFEDGDYNKVLSLAETQVRNGTIPQTADNIQLLTNYPKLFEEFIKAIDAKYKTVKAFDKENVLAGKPNELPIYGIESSINQSTGRLDINWVVVKKETITNIKYLEFGNYTASELLSYKNLLQQELEALEQSDAINKKIERVEKKIENKNNIDLNSKDGIVPDLTSKDKTAIEESLEDAINNPTETGKTTSPQGNLVYDGDKIINAATALAYLAKNYEEVYKTFGTTEIVSKRDISEGLNEDMQEPLLLSDKHYQVGEELYLELDKAFNVILKDGTTLTYNQFKDNVDMVPIKITNKDGKTIAYLHTLDWISEKNVAGGNNNIEVQRKILSDLRKEVYDKNKISTKIVSKSYGKLSLTKDDQRKTADLIKAPVKFAVGKDNVLWTGQGVALTGNQPINRKINSGLVYMVVPTPVAGKTIALPVFNTKIGDHEKIANTLANAVEIFFNQDKEVADDIYDKLGIDLLTNNGLRQFFNLFTTTNSFDESDISNAFGRPDKLFLDVLGNGIKYGLGGLRVKDVGNLEYWDREDFIKSINNGWVSVFLNHMNKPTFKYAFINDNKEVEYKESTYPEFIKEYTTTNIVEQDLGNNEYSYFVQPVINIDSNTEVFYSEEEKEFFAKRDKEDRENQASQQADDIDWDSIDLLPVVDELPSSVSNREASEIAKNSSLISGFTAARQDQIIQMMNSHILFGVTEDDTKTIAEHYEDFKKVIIDYKAKADRSTNAKAKPLSDELQKILDNFDKFKEQSVARLKMFNLKETPTGELTGFEDLDSNNEKTNFDDGATFQIDSKDGMSGRLKQFLSFVPNPKKNYIGLEAYMPYDEVVNYLSGQLAGLDASYADIALKLEEISASNPWVKSVKELLDNSSEQIKNEFVQWATKHYTGFKIVNLIRSDKDFTVKVMDSDQNSVSKLIQLKWLINLKTSSLVKETTPGNLVINNDARKSLVEEVKNIDKNDLNAVKSWLSKIGIEVSMPTLEAIKANTRIPFEKQFTDANGYFTYIIENLSKATLEGDDSFESNNPLLNNSSSRKLAYLEAQHSPAYFSNSFKNGEGKTIYSYSANKYFIKQFYKLKNNKDNHLNDLLKINFSSTSSWGKELSNQNSYFSQVFDYFYLDTLKVANDGTTLSSMSSREHEVTKIGLFQNQNNGSDKKGRICHFLFPTMSDKTTMTGLTALRHDTKLRFTSEGMQIGKETIDALFNIVEAEYKRIRASYDIDNTVDGYNPNKFYFFEELNDNLYDPEKNPNGLWEVSGGNKPNQLRPLTSEIENHIKDILKNHIEELINAKIEHWNKLGLIKDGALKFADKTYIADIKSSLSKEFKTNSEVVTKYAAADYVINYVIANANAFQLFIGDPAQFAKKTLEATWINIGKRLAGEIAPGLELADSKDNKYTQAFIQDSTGALRISKNFAQIEKLLGKELAAPYADIESTDAQEYTTLAEHLYVLEKSGKISSEEAKTLLEKEETGKLSKKDLKTIFQPIKPVYVNTQIEPSLDLNRKIYIKSSSFPLVKGLSPELDKLRTQMLAQGVDRVAFKSATKVGGPKNYINIFNEDGTIKDNIDFSNKLLLNREGFRLQQEVPFDETKEAINRGTQESKLLFANLLDVDGFEYNGKSISGKELQDEYNQLNKVLYENAKAELLRELEYSNGEINIYRVQEMLVAEAESRGWPQNDIDALKIVSVDKFTETFALPLWASSSANRIEALLNSLVDNRVRKQKFRGKSFVLASEEGFAGKSKNIIYTKNYNPETGLLPQRIVDGKVLPAQILITNNLRDINGKLIDLRQYINEDGLLDLTKIDESLLRVFGFRIPTQGHNSMTYAEVVGFLPSYMGDLVIAPKDYTKQMGSDFDIDKLYLYMYNTQKSGDSLTKFTYSDSEIEKLYDNVKNKKVGYNNKVITEVFKDAYWIDTFEGDLESFKFEFKQRELQNKLLDIHFSVFTNPDLKVQKQILNPLGFGNLPELAEKVDKYRNKRNTKRKFTKLSDTYQKEKYLKARGGKSGTGVKSLDSVFTAISQGKDIKVGFNDENGVQYINLVFGDADGEAIELHDISHKNSVDGNPKLNTVAAYQSAAVDNEKEQILEKINSNDYTFDAERALAAVGFTEDYIVPLTAQDIIFEYTEEMSRMQDSLNDSYIANPEQTVIRMLLDKYTREAGFSAEVAEKLIDSNHPLTQKEMWEAIKDGPQYSEYYKVQIWALMKFDKARNIGKEISNIQLTVNTDSSGIAPSLIESNFKEDKVKDIASNKMILNAENLLKDTINGYATENALFLANELWSGYFPYSKERVKQTFQEIQMLTGKDVLTNTARQKIFNNIKSFVFSMKKLDVADVTDRQSMFFDTPDNKSLATKIKELQKTSNNPFIQRLIPEPDITGTKPSLIKYNAGAGENFNELSVYQGFTDLFLNENTRDIAQQLVEYFYLSGGIQEAIQFGKYIPIAYLMNRKFAEELRKLNFNDENLLGIPTYKDHYYEVSNFAKQWIQHNPGQAIKLKDDLSQIKNIKRNADKTIVEFESDINIGKDLLVQRVNPQTNKRVQVLPEFVSLSDVKSPKRFKLYQYVGNNKYVQIDVLGTFGYSEYSQENTNVKSLVKGNQASTVYVEPVKIDTNESKDDEVKNNYNPLYRAKKYKLEEGIKASLEVVANSKNPLHANLAKEILSKKLDDIKISIVDNKNVRGSFNYSTNGGSILINPENHFSDYELERTILHEVLHGLTGNIIRSSNRTAEQQRIVNSLTALQKAFKDKIASNPEWQAEYDAFVKAYEAKEGLDEIQISKNYGAMKLTEFVTMAMTDVEFQKILNDIPFTGEKSMLDRFMDLIKSLLNSLGFEIKSGSVLEESVKNIVELINLPENLVESEESSNLANMNYTLPTGKTITFNNQQVKAIEDIREFLESDNSFYTLSGFAGTGKTTIVKYILDSYNGRVAVSAPTHKAKNVISKATDKAASTIQALLGLQPNTDLENFNINKPQFDTKSPPTISRYSLIILDEASMLNKDLFKMLTDQAEKHGTKILFMGDPAQLPPVNEHMSEVFKSSRVSGKSELTKVERQAGDNPLMSIYDNIRNNLKSSEDTFEHLTSINDNGDGVIFTNNYKKFEKKAIELFNSPEYLKDKNYVKMLTWTNQDVKEWNTIIRDSIFNTKELLVPGDLLMAYNTISLGGYNLIENSSDYEILSVTNSVSSDGIPVYDVKFKNVDKESGYDDNMNIVKKEGYSQFATRHQELLNNAIKFKGKHWVYYYSFKKAHLLLEDIRDNSGNLIVKKDLDYGYAITVHKSQGSTYTNVLINEDNLDRNQNAEERNKLKYVALSRPTDQAIILSNKTIDKTDELPVSQLPELKPC